MTYVYLGCFAVCAALAWGYRPGQADALSVVLGGAILAAFPALAIWALFVR